jgi:hypothetical protein
MKSYPPLSKQINRTLLRDRVHLTAHVGDTVAAVRGMFGGSAGPQRSLPLHAASLDALFIWMERPVLHCRLATRSLVRRRAQQTKLISPETGKISLKWYLPRP